MNNRHTVVCSTFFGCLCSISSMSAQHPNIVLIMTDQQRADICGREGFPLPVTPFADETARQGVWFDKAYTSCPASVPARTSLVTGRYPTATHVLTNHNVMDAYFKKDLLQVLKENNYQTALVGKNHCYLKPSDFDYFDGYFHWGKNNKETSEDSAFARYLNVNRGQSLKANPFPVEAQNPYKIVTEALNWVKEHSSKPFFLCVSFPEPHNPYQVSEPYYSMFPTESLPLLRTSRKDLKKKGEKYQILATLEDKACPDLQKDLPRLRSNYYGMIRLIDDQERRLIDGFRKIGAYSNTVFVILSDHGDYCGEYGLIRKGAGVPECLTRIPMIWFGKDIVANSKPSDACVSIMDVFPTICNFIGAEIPDGVQGRSLWPLLTGKNYPKAEFESIVVQQGYGGENFNIGDDSLTFQKEGAYHPKSVAFFDELNTWTQSGARWMIKKGDYKLVMDSYGNGDLYNLKIDPAEVNNLFDSKKDENHKIDLLRSLSTWTIRLQDPLPYPHNRYHFKRNKYNYHTDRVLHQ